MRKGVLVAGVDGYKGGWVSILLHDGTFHGATASATFSELLERHRDAEVIAIDIPIGLSPTGTREADVEARQRLKGQASSVFPTPPRAALDELTYEGAGQAAFEASGKRLSQQSFALMTRIREVDKLTRPGERVYEVHPEVSFRELAGSPIRYRKKTWNGQMHRRRLLEDVGIILPDDLGPAARVPVDDVLDAAAAAWTAHRIARREAQSLPDPPEEVDGRRVAIWY